MLASRSYCISLKEASLSNGVFPYVFLHLNCSPIFWHRFLFSVPRDSPIARKIASPLAYYRAVFLVFSNTTRYLSSPKLLDCGDIVGMSNDIWLFHDCDKIPWCKELHDGGFVGSQLQVQTIMAESLDCRKVRQLVTLHPQPKRKEWWTLMFGSLLFFTV